MLYMVGQTRVHLDAVEGLGDFMELEVQLSVVFLTSVISVVVAEPFQTPLF